MKSILFRWMPAAVALFACATTGRAFEPLFYVSEAHGACTVQRPGAQQPDAVMKNRAYPSGSRFQTGADGSVTLQFSERNSALVHSNTTVIAADGAGGVNHKVLKLENGYVDVRLETTFDEGGKNRVTVETASSVGEPLTGGDYEFIVQPEEDRIVSLYRVTARGNMKVYDNLMFEIASVKHEARAEVAISKDKQYTCLRNLRGKLQVELKNVATAEGTPRIVDTQPDGVIKMWKNLSPVGRVWTVEILVIAPDGALEQDKSVSYETKASG